MGVWWSYSQVMTGWFKRSEGDFNSGCVTGGRCSCSQVRGWFRCSESDFNSWEGDSGVQQVISAVEREIRVVSWWFQQLRGWFRCSEGDFNSWEGDSGVQRVISTVERVIQVFSRRFQQVLCRRWVTDVGERGGCYCRSLWVTRAWSPICWRIIQRPLSHGAAVHPSVLRVGLMCCWMIQAWWSCR